MHTGRIANMFIYAYGDILFEQDFDKYKTSSFTAKVAHGIIDSTFTRFPSGPNMYEA